MDNRLTAILGMFQEFQKIHPEMPMQIAATFLNIVDKPGVSLRELEDRVGLAKSSVHRGVKLLAKGKAGRGAVVTLSPDPRDPRRLLAYPSAEGLRVAGAIDAYMSPRRAR